MKTKKMKVKESEKKEERQTSHHNKENTQQKQKYCRQVQVWIIEYKEDGL